jgi:hypothetical protein
MTVSMVQSVLINVSSFLCLLFLFSYSKSIFYAEGCTPFLASYNQIGDNAIALFTERKSSTLTATLK